jgi:hypothetical protein
VLQLPSNAPQGMYSLEVGLYDAHGRLELANAGRTDRILLAQIVVK